MKKNGFTLIELLAVITILGLVLIIALPTVNNIVNNSRTKVFKENEKKLRQSAEVYFSNAFRDMPKNIGDSLFVSLYELRKEAITEDIRDPKDNSFCDQIKSGVTVTKTEKLKYDYTPYLKCANFTSTTSTKEINNIEHTYNTGTNNYTINVDLQDDKDNFIDIVTEGYSIGFIKPTLIDYTQWRLNTSGSQGSFSINGTTAENQIILHSNPWGKMDVTWATLTNDEASNADGGWNNSNKPIDRTQKYRFSVWIRREDVGNGRTYIGTQASTVANLSDGSTNTNPYFYSHLISGVPQVENNWLLYIAYIHPYDYTLTTSDPTNGIYHGQTKTRLTGVTDFKWTSTATVGGHRTYLYYSTSINEHHYWYRPRFEVVDGTEPTIQELLKGEENPNINDYSAIGTSNQISFIVNNAGRYNFTLTKRDGSVHKFSYTILK